MANDVCAHPLALWMLEMDELVVVMRSSGEKSCPCPRPSLEHADKKKEMFSYNYISNKTNGK